jgi:hypothetical protein
MEAPYGILDEIREAEFLTQPATDKHARLLEAQWLRWRKAKDVINEDIRRAYLRRLEDVGREIDADRQKQMHAELGAQLAAHAAADAAENQRYLDGIVAARRKREADWKKQALARLARATASINREIVDRERRVFGIRKRR